MGSRRTRRYIVTNEVSNARLNRPFLESMKTWADAVDGEIVVIRSLYKLQGIDEEEYTFNSDLNDYVIQGQRQIGKILVQGDVTILPTAVRPLSGFSNFGKGLTCIFGHPKQHLESLPTIGNIPPQYMATTGACVDVRYNTGKAGRKAEFAQCIGGIIVEVTSRGTHIRHVHADKRTGVFTDLGYSFSPDGVQKEGTEAVILGDTHVPYQDEELYDKIFDRLLPKILHNEGRGTDLIIHDVIDFSVRNHHNSLNPIMSAGFQNQSVQSELEKSSEFLSDHRFKKFDGIYLVDSNHDRALDRWINENDWRTDPVNAELMLELALLKIRSTKIVNGEPSSVSALEIWMTLQPFFKDSKITFIKGSKTVKGWETSLHGDKGANGARGSLMSYSKLPTKLVVGHSHSSGMSDGAIQVGHTRMPAGFAQGGASSWSQSIALIYSTGKAQLLIFDERKRCSASDTIKKYENCVS